MNQPTEPLTDTTRGPTGSNGRRGMGAHSVGVCCPIERWIGPELRGQGRDRRRQILDLEVLTASRTCNNTINRIVKLLNYETFPGCSESL